MQGTHNKFVNDEMTKINNNHSMTVPNGQEVQKFGIASANRNITVNDPLYNPINLYRCKGVMQMCTIYAYITFIHQNIS